jgi:hypothetical protein
VAKHMKRILRATKPHKRAVQARSFEVVDEHATLIATLGPIPGSTSVSQASAWCSTDPMARSA